MCEIGKKIKELRTSHGITQWQLGEKIGVSEKVISKWENGDTAPGVEYIPAIADVFDIDTDFLFDRKRESFNSLHTTLMEYMKSVPEDQSISEAHKLFQYLTIGAEMSAMADSGYYSDDALAEIQDSLVLCAEQKDERIQCHSHGELHEDKANTFWSKEYMQNALWSVQRGEMKMCVLQNSDDVYMTDALGRYGLMRKLFAFLALDDADKLLGNFVFNNKAKNFTLEHLVKTAAVSKETAKKFIELLFDLKENTNEMIIGKREAVISDTQTTIYDYHPGVFETILKSVVLTASVLTRERNGFR